MPKVVTPKDERGESKNSVKVLNYTGSLIDQARALIGIYDKDMWLQEHPLGLKTDQGTFLYGPTVPETKTISTMWEIANAAQMYYKKCGRYPSDSQSDPDALKALDRKIDYSNPYSKQELPPAIFCQDWPEGEPTDAETSLEKKWKGGEHFSSGVEVPGGILCAQLGSPKLPIGLKYPTRGSQKVDYFFIEGCNQYNDLIKRFDNTPFIVTLKNGQDITPDAAPPVVPNSSQPGAAIVISSSERPAKLSIALQYGLLALVLLLILVGYLRLPSMGQSATRAKKK
jgi:hypothetical protein